MLKDYLKENNLSIYSLSKKTGIPYSTLNDLCNGKVEIENCKVDLLLKLSSALSLSLQETMDICKNEMSFYVGLLNDYASIHVKNKRFKVQFDYLGEHIEHDLCKVNDENKEYIYDVALWDVEDYINDHELKKRYESLTNEN